MKYLLLIMLIPFIINAEIIDRVEVTVNDSFISMQDLNYEINKLALSGGRLNGFEPYSILLGELLRNEKVQKQLEEKGFMLEILIAEKLILQEAEKIGIEVSDYEIQRLKNSIIERNNTTEKNFERALLEQGLTMSKFEKLLKKRSIIEKIKQQKVFPKIAISDLEIENYYKIHYRNKYKYNLAYIYIKELPSFTEEEKKEVKEKLEKIKKELQNEDFEEVAKKYTQGPYKEIGGRLGFIKEGVFTENLENAIKKLKKGEYTEPVKTDNGWHIFKLLDKEKDESENYESKKNEIYQILIYKKWHKVFFDWLESLKRKAYLDYKYDYGNMYGKNFSWSIWYEKIK